MAAELRSQLSEVVSKLPSPPTLAVILVGDDPASHVYVKNKIKFTKQVGMNSQEVRFPKDVSQKELLLKIDLFNESDEVDGILLQLPLPKHIDSNKAIDAISPDKDVDGLTEISAGRLSLGKTGLRPCTPTGCVMLAKKALGDLSGKNCVIIGRSILVGKPAALLFLQENCTVTIAHSRTKNIENVCREADILIAAVGIPELVQRDWIKPGACVIDVGINRVPIPIKPGKTKLVGDVNYEDVKQTVGYLTPVPGGVGPMTISCLLRNTVIAACRRRRWNKDYIVDL